jgi:hypothetical protein
MIILRLRVPASGNSSGFGAIESMRPRGLTRAASKNLVGGFSQPGGHLPDLADLRSDDFARPGAGNDVAERAIRLHLRGVVIPTRSRSQLT